MIEYVCYFISHNIVYFIQCCPFFPKKKTNRTISNNEGDSIELYDTVGSVLNKIKLSHLKYKMIMKNNESVIVYNASLRYHTLSSQYIQYIIIEIFVNLFMDIFHAFYTNYHHIINNTIPYHLIIFICCGIYLFCSSFLLFTTKIVNLKLSCRFSNESHVYMC